jgi:hypothetical protein
MIPSMAAVTGRAKRSRGDGPKVQMSLFARIDPEVRELLDRGSAALGIGLAEYIEAIVRHLEAETPEGLPAWVVDRVRSKQLEAEQLELRESA